jgi:hypothetical protein
LALKKKPAILVALLSEKKMSRFSLAREWGVVIPEGAPVCWGDTRSECNLARHGLIKAAYLKGVELCA